MLHHYLKLVPQHNVELMNEKYLKSFTSTGIVRLCFTYLKTIQTSIGILLRNDELICNLINLLLNMNNDIEKRAIKFN